MKFPAPRPGLVIRYGFLWSHEARGGASEASKDRPCAIVVAAKREKSGDIRVIVAPITHRPASDPTDSIAVPSEVCRLLGLDGEAQWLRTDELNSFSWPGFDLRPIPGRATVEYGMLPRDLFHQLRSKILQRQKEKKLNTPVDRD